MNTELILKFDYDLNCKLRMFKMSKRTLRTYFPSTSGTGTSATSGTNDSTNQPKIRRVEFSQSNVVGDPGNRKPIEEYAHEIRDQVRRAYALSGPTQPRNFIFPRKWQTGQWRSFQKTWFDEFDWLEYSEKKDAAYCLYCYLFFDRGSLKNLVALSLQRMGMLTGKMLRTHLINTLLARLTTMLG